MQVIINLSGNTLYYIAPHVQDHLLNMHLAWHDTLGQRSFGVQRTLGNGDSPPFPEMTLLLLSGGSGLARGGHEGNHVHRSPAFEKHGGGDDGNLGYTDRNSKDSDRGRTKAGQILPVIVATRRATLV